MSYAEFPPLGQSLIRMDLARAGFPPDVAERYRRLERDAHRSLDDAGLSRNGRRAWIVPGRIEVLGKHVDYAGGRSLLCTVERGLVLVAVPRNDGNVILRDARRRESMVVSIAPSPFPPTQAPLPWAVYPRTVVRRLFANFGDVMIGADIALASNLPPAAGVSSSSALIVGITLALMSLSRVHENTEWHDALTPRTRLAGYIGSLENGADFGMFPGERGVGTLGGAQDQTAIMCCAPGKLDVFSWSPVRHERAVAWPKDYVFVVGVSGVVAAKTGAARDRYNQVARTAHHLVDAWNRSGGTAKTLADAFHEAHAHVEQTTGESANRAEVPLSLIAAAQRAADEEFPELQLVSRLHQFHRESEIYVPAAASALATSDVATFGTVVAASQRQAEMALGNQIPETVALVRLALENGAVASSAFGAGFGGSVWAMVPSSDAAAFIDRWRAAYVTNFPNLGRRFQSFQTRPGAPAFEAI